MKVGGARLSEEQFSEIQAAPDVETLTKRICCSRTTGLEPNQPQALECSPHRSHTELGGLRNVLGTAVDGSGRATPSTDGTNKMF